jgi:hypothetical protein
MANQSRWVCDECFTIHYTDEGICLCGGSLGYVKNYDAQFCRCNHPWFEHNPGWEDGTGDVRCKICECVLLLVHVEEGL